ncbi:QueT transporter family protein, partial [Clostridioides difficile]|nr:QueT transporter family protein [Clostridioides difficile]
MKSKNISTMTQAAMIAAIYVVLTYVFAPFSFGEVQVRIAESLTILPLFTPAAIPGLFIGCLIGNILGGAILPDIIFGSLATLLGAIFTYRLRNKNKILAPVPPIVANTVIVPFVLRFGYGVALPIPLMMLT